MAQPLATIVAATMAAMVATPAAAACELKELLELKVTMDDHRPMVDTKLNGRDARFVVDSGAFFSTVPAAVAKEYGLVPVPLPRTLRLVGVGGVQDAGAARAATLSFGKITLSRIEFVVGGSEVGAVGLLGQNVLGVADVEYDLGHGAVRIMRPEGCKGADVAYWAKNRAVSDMAIEDKASAGTHTIGSIRVNGKRLRAVFDTGAATSVMSLAAARRVGVDIDGPGAQRDGFGVGVGRKRVRDWIVPVASVALEGEEIKNTKLRVGDFDLGNGDMLLGADFFLSHRIYVSNHLHRLFFTYEGGPIFDLRVGRLLDANGVVQAAPTDSAEAPTTGDDYARRAAAEAGRQEFPKALADISRAIELAPGEARFYRQRAQLRLRMRQQQSAADDLDKALSLAPNDLDARLLRAEVRTGRHDRAAAIQDLEALDGSLAPPSDIRLTLGGLFGANRDFDRAIAQFDRWLSAHPDDVKRPAAFNGRCWARAQAGRDLDRALSDCNAALRGRPNTPAYLDSRGLVKLRRGDLDGALADYDAALSQAPKLAWALYGRSIVRARKGLMKESAADRDAALSLQPDLVERARELGVTG